MAWRELSTSSQVPLGCISPAEKSCLHPPFFFLSILLCFVLGNPRWWQTGCAKHKIWVLRSFHFYCLFQKQLFEMDSTDLTHQNLPSETALTLHRHCVCFSKLRSKQMWDGRLLRCGELEAWWFGHLALPRWQELFICPAALPLPSNEAQ